MKKKKCTFPLRAVIQLVFLLLAPGVFASAFGAVKNACMLIGQHAPLMLSAHTIALLGLLSFTLLFGRFFCGHACAFGALGDVVYALAQAATKKLNRPLPTLPKRWHKHLATVKYVVLLGIMLLCVLGGQPWLHGKSPWDAFAQLLSGSPTWTGYEISYILLALLLIGMALVPRFFCRFFCPLGAIFSLLPPALLLRLKKPTGKQQGRNACGSCTLCSCACPAQLSLTKQDTVTSGQCLGCYRCITACYQEKPFLQCLAWQVLLPIARIALAILLLTMFFMLGMTRW